MSDVKWIKLATNIFSENRKIKSIEIMPKGDTLITIWFKLLTLAGKINDGGAIYITPEVPYSLRALASELKRPIKTVKTALETFKNYEMITMKDDFIYLSSWCDYQNVEGLEALREYNRLAQQRSRSQRKEQQNVNDNVNDKNSKMSMTCQKENKEGKRTKKEEIKENIKDIEGEIKTKNLDTPTLEEVTAYCNSKGYDFAEKFFYFYNGVCWRNNNGTPIDWRAKADYWALSNAEKKPSRAGDFDPEEAFRLALERTEREFKTTKGDSDGTHV